MKLDPSESFRNMGQLRVEVLRGTSLPVGDRTGFSDPYCKFKLNDKDVYKTETKKKTLDPVWNESFEVQVRSRTAAKFCADVYDWDFGDKDDFLGKSSIDLKLLEPYQAKEVTVPLDTTGSITLRLLFTPDYVARQRQGSSTFHGTLMATGKVAGAPVKTIGKGASVISGGVVKTGSFLGKSFLRRKSRGANDMEEVEDNSGTATPAETTPPLPGTPIPAIATEAPAGASHARSPSGVSTNGAIASTESGVASLSVVSTAGFPPSANVRVHLSLEPQGRHAREVHKTKAIKSATGEVRFDPTVEHVRAPCTADTPFRVVVKDHSTLGRDDVLGEATFYVADQGSGAEQVVRVGKGDGRVVLKSSFEAGDVASVSGASMKLGRVFGTKRDGRERSVTPGA
jgi:Ca2+-dependent lipid-binding protein